MKHYVIDKDKALLILRSPMWKSKMWCKPLDWDLMYQQWLMILLMMHAITL